MLRTHKYVIEDLTKKAMGLLLCQNEVRYFILNGCSHYMCWLNENQIAFGSAEIEVIINKCMNEGDVKIAFAAYIDPSYSEKIDYYFWKEITTMDKLKKENPWFNMWKANNKTDI